LCQTLVAPRAGAWIETIAAFPIIYLSRNRARARNSGNGQTVIYSLHQSIGHFFVSGKVAKKGA
jgi:hypothetical protein